MCSLLNIRFHLIVKRNYKAVGIERFYNFLKYSQRICSEERGTHTIFIECDMTTTYLWNKSLIYGADIIRSIPTLSKVLNFPYDIYEYPVTPIDNLTKSIIE